MTIQKLNKVCWEASHRPLRSSGIATGEYEKALSAHIEGDFARAIALVQCIPGWQTHPAAHRIVGLASEGSGNAEAAIQSHIAARDLNSNSGDSEAQAGDEINLGSAFVAFGDTDSALDAYKRAFALKPDWLPGPLGIISVLNRQGCHTELQHFLEELLAADPNVATNQVFTDHLTNDTDFIGVAQLLRQPESITDSPNDP